MDFRRTFLVAFAVASASFSGCKTDDPVDVPPYPELPEPQAKVAEPVNENIVPGETLDLFVIEDDRFNGKYTVRAQGDIILPKIGRIQIGGSSISSAESVVKATLEVDQLKNATVILARPGALPPGGGEDLTKPEKPTVEIFVSGKVLQPGRYRIASVGAAPPSVYQSILQAGGFSRWAYPKKVYILRRGSDGILSRIEANIDAISSGKQPDVSLLSGDIVVVPEKKIGV